MTGYLFFKSDIVAAIGAFTVGVLSNLYARLSKSSSFVVAIVGVLYLVPVSSGLSEPSRSCFADWFCSLAWQQRAVW